MKPERIGWIGLGKMGVPMLQRLINSGFETVVFNRTKDRVQLLSGNGVSVAETPAELIRQVDLVFLMVSDDAAVKEICLSDTGLLREKVSGKTIVNMSTVSPGISREMAVHCRTLGCDYLDAPVSGSVKQAEEGLLVVIAGGDKAVYEKVKPQFEKLGKLSVYMGESGSGNAAKLAVNTFVGIISQGLAEVMAFASQMNVNAGDLLTIINNSALGSPFIRLKGEAIQNNNFEAAFALKHMVKDLTLARESGLDSPLGNLAQLNYKEAAAKGLGEKDVIAIFDFLHRKI